MDVTVQFEINLCCNFTSADFIDESQPIPSLNFYLPIEQLLRWLGEET